MRKFYSPIRIIFADDHEVVREGFQVMMKKQQDIEIIGEAKNGEHLLRLVRQLSPDVVVTDIQMPKMGGIEATKEILKEFPAIGVIAFSMYDEESLVIDMLKAGAAGYLMKNSPREEVVNAIKAVNKGQTYYCRQTGKILSRAGASTSKFSERELSITRLICEEASNAEIAEKLKLSRRTIESYRQKIMEKMNVKNAVGIVLYAIKNKIYHFRK